jgi:glycosyltransferase involved in cell wall biosynthesis
MMDPRVTVLMPVYNGARFIREAIESVLAQTFGDFELLVLDDGSADGSAELVASYRDPRIRLVWNEGHRGLVPTLNQGLALARGILIARQDADDRSHRRRLADQVQRLREQPELALVGTQARVIDPDGRVIGALNRPQEAVSIRWYHLFDNAFIHSSVMFRRAAAERLSGYEPLAHCEDYALWSRMALAHPVANLPGRLVDYRANPRSVYGGLTLEQAGASAEGNRRIIQRNLRAMFGDGEWSDADVALLARFRLGLSESDLGGFLALFHRLRARYEARAPEATRSPDFRRTLARQYDEIASKLSPAGRASAVRVYASGIRHDPLLAWALSWPQALTLALLGRDGRRRLRARLRAILRPRIRGPGLVQGVRGAPRGPRPSLGVSRDDNAGSRPAAAGRGFAAGP